MAERSRKTSLIFCSSLAFIVFAGAMFSLQADSIVANLKVALGSDLRIDSRIGTQFTSFTGTKVQILTLQLQAP